MKMFWPISENNIEFSVNFFRNISTESIEDRLDEQNHLMLYLSNSDREKYVNDYFAMMQVLQERKQDDKIRNI